MAGINSAWMDLTTSLTVSSIFAAAFTASSSTLACARVECLSSRKTFATSCTAVGGASSLRASTPVFRPSSRSFLTSASCSAVGSA